jgi:hypothetical protein
MEGEIRALQAEVDDLRSTVENLVSVLYKRKVSAAELERAAWQQRIVGGTHLYWLDEQFWGGLAKADVLTLEEVASRPRNEIAAIRGVGPVTMAKLDAALAVEGLSYGEAR